jgi:hypothetical protein
MPRRRVGGSCCGADVECSLPVVRRTAHGVRAVDRFAVHRTGPGPCVEINPESARPRNGTGRRPLDPSRAAGPAVFWSGIV